VEKIRPGEWRFGKVHAQDSIETLELLDREVLAVVTQVFSKSLDLA
jgi:hypothetical protein